MIIDNVNTVMQVLKNHFSIAKRHSKFPGSILGFFKNNRIDSKIILVCFPCPKASTKIILLALWRNKYKLSLSFYYRKEKYSKNWGQIGGKSAVY